MKRKDSRARRGKGSALSRGQHTREGTSAVSNNPRALLNGCSTASSQAFRYLLGNNTYRKSCPCVCSQIQFRWSQETCIRMGDWTRSAWGIIHTPRLFLPKFGAIFIHLQKKQQTLQISTHRTSRVRCQCHTTLPPQGHRPSACCSQPQLC